MDAAAARRAAATQYAAEHSDGPAGKRTRSRLIWSDALLAILQSDTVALATQRKALRTTLGNDDAATASDRTLAAFQESLRHKKRAAADSLAAIDLDAPESTLGSRDGFARSVDHLAGAQMLLSVGDTVRALKLLTWCEADTGDNSTFNWFAPTADLWLGRIADAQHRKTDAIYYYHQFLQWYDFPMPAIQPVIDEARRTLARLYGLAEPARKP